MHRKAVSEVVKALSAALKRKLPRGQNASARVVVVTPPWPNLLSPPWFPGAFAVERAEDRQRLGGLACLGRREVGIFDLLDGLIGWLFE